MLLTAVQSLENREDGLRVKNIVDEEESEEYEQRGVSPRLESGFSTAMTEEVVSLILYILLNKL